MSSCLLLEKPNVKMADNEQTLPHHESDDEGLDLQVSCVYDFDDDMTDEDSDGWISYDDHSESGDERDAPYIPLPDHIENNDERFENDIYPEQNTGERRKKEYFEEDTNVISENPEDGKTYNVPFEPPSDSEDNNDSDGKDFKDLDNEDCDDSELKGFEASDYSDSDDSEDESSNKILDIICVYIRESEFGVVDYYPVELIEEEDQGDQCDPDEKSFEKPEEPLDSVTENEDSDSSGNGAADDGSKKESGDQDDDSAKNEDAIKQMNVKETMPTTSVTENEDGDSSGKGVAENGSKKESVDQNDDSANKDANKQMNVKETMPTTSVNPKDD